MTRPVLRNDLVFPDDVLMRVTERMLASATEEAAIAFCTPVGGAGSVRRLVVDVWHPTNDEYVQRSDAGVTLSPSVVLRAARRAQRKRLSLVFLHTHPFAENALFSAMDDAGERALVEFLNRIAPDLPHAALLVSRNAYAARDLGSESAIRVLEIGANRRVHSSRETQSIDVRYDRQVRALGSAGQQLIGELTIGVVGLGGTGSLVSQQLAHLGVKDYLLIDPDCVESSNLNRLAGASLADVGRPKVQVAERTIRGLVGDPRIRGLMDSINFLDCAKMLADCDIVFGCTDTHASRAILGHVAYQYYVPVIDLGVAIGTIDGRVSHIAGRVQLLSPGLPCFACANMLDGDQIRRDLMSETELNADPYFVGPGEPQPSVMPFNAVVAGLAVSMFLAVLTGVGTTARFQLLDALRGTVRRASLSRDPLCVVCSSHGVLGLGDQVEMPAKRRQ